MYVAVHCGKDVSEGVSEGSGHDVQDASGAGVADTGGVAETVTDVVGLVPGEGVGEHVAVSVAVRSKSGVFDGVYTWLVTGAGVAEAVKDAVSGVIELISVTVDPGKVGVTAVMVLDSVKVGT